MTTLFIVLAAQAGLVAADSSPFSFEFEELAPGVWSGVRPDGPRFPVMGNTVFVVSDDGVVVFDGGGMPAMSEQIIGKIRELTAAPVTHVITSHWHGDHNFGIYRFAEEYDDVKFIAHRFTRDMMHSTRLNYIDRGPGFISSSRESFERIVAEGVDDDGKTYGETERALYQRMLDDGELIESEARRARVTPPTVVMDDALVIESGGRRIELLHLGHANTAGDIVMWLPEERIVASGDIVVLPSPYAFNVPPRPWAETLRALNALNYDVLVPGHGAIQRNSAYVELIIEAALDIADQRDRLVATGVDADSIAAELDLSAFEERFTGGNEYVRLHFESWFEQPLKAAAVKALDDGPMVPIPAPVSVDFDDHRWQFTAAEHEVVDYRGRRSLRLKGGTAILEGIEILNGVLEFDIAIPRERGFAGAEFRVVDANNYENFYVRPHQSGNPDANQYQPVIQGQAAWQLYHGEGYGAPVDYRYNEWMPVRIVFGGRQAQVFIDSDEPVLEVTDLKREVSEGGIGLVAANFAGVHFSNFRYAELASAWSFPRAAVSPAAAGVILHWDISGPIKDDLLESLTHLDSEFLQQRDFRPAEAEPSGILNLARFLPDAAEGNTMLARIRLTAAADEIRMLDLGYSDRARVYVNGALRYRGDNTYQSRDYRYLGTIGFFDSIALPLESGSNEIVVAVSESFGGWGLMGRIASP